MAVLCGTGSFQSTLVALCKMETGLPISQAVEISEILGNTLKVFSPWFDYPNLREVRE